MSRRRSRAVIEAVPANPCKIFIGNLPRFANMTSISTLLGPYGQAEVDIKKHPKYPESCKGFALATFQSSEEATAAVQALSGSFFLGRSLLVKPDIGVDPRRDHGEAEEARGGNRKGPGAQGSGYRAASPAHHGGAGLLAQGLGAGHARVRREHPVGKHLADGARPHDVRWPRRVSGASSKRRLTGQTAEALGLARLRDRAVLHRRGGQPRDREPQRLGAQRPARCTSSRTPRAAARRRARSLGGPRRARRNRPPDEGESGSRAISRAGGGGGARCAARVRARAGMLDIGRCVHPGEGPCGAAARAKSTLFEVKLSARARSRRCACSPLPAFCRTHFMGPLNLSTTEPQPACGRLDLPASVESLGSLFSHLFASCQFVASRIDLHFFRKIDNAKGCKKRKQNFESLMVPAQNWSLISRSTRCQKKSIYLTIFSRFAH